MSASVDIVIVNWNTGDYLRECLRSLTLAHAEIIATITVVDNASADDSAEGLDAFPLPLELIRNHVNTGFAAACNQGAAGGKAEYVLFLNPDTRLFEETLSRVVAFMDGDGARGVGICGVQVVGEDGRPRISCARFPTLRILLGKLTGLDRVAPRLFPSHHLTAEEIRHSRVVDQVIGAFFLVRRALFAELGGFDRRYFIYYEEVDFALRARRRGARSYFLKEASVLHVENVSSDKVPGSRLYHSMRSRRLYAYAHWPRWQAHLLLLVTLTVEPAARFGRAIVRRSAPDAAATVTGYRRFLGDLLRV